MHHSRVSRAAALCLLLVALGGCKKKQPTALGRPPAPDPNSVVCPPVDKLVQAVQQDQKDRAVRASCVVFAPGYYWLGAAVSYDAKTTADVRLHLLSGGQSQRIFDIVPAPAEALANLIKGSSEVEVRIRKAGSDNRLVRLGLMGRKPGAGKELDGDEIGMVLQLVAHQPPKLLWTGAGDQLRTTADGCQMENLVNFEMPFGNRLEMVTSSRAKGGASNCTSGPSSQQQIEWRGVAIKPGRPLLGI